MRSWVYIGKCSMALSQAALPARGLRKAGRLFLGYVAQFTVESRFHRAEHILNPGYPGRKGVRCYSTQFYTGRLRLVGVGGRWSPQKIFSALRASVLSKNKEGGRSRGPSPGSATAPRKFWILGFLIVRCGFWIPDSLSWIPDSKAQDCGFQKQKFPWFTWAGRSQVWLLIGFVLNQNTSVEVCYDKVHFSH